jgi:hypothetical protein
MPERLRDLNPTTPDALELELEGVLRLADAATDLGQPNLAKLLADVVARVRRAAEPYLDRLTETEAVLRSGRSRTWLRAMARQVWVHAGDAWVDGGRYSYRRLVVPAGTPASVTRAAGRKAAA